MDENNSNTLRWSTIAIIFVISWACGSALHVVNDSAGFRDDCEWTYIDESVEKCEVPSCQKLSVGNLITRIKLMSGRTYYYRVTGNYPLCNEHKNDWSRWRDRGSASKFWGDVIGGGMFGGGFITLFIVLAVNRLRKRKA